MSTRATRHPNRPVLTEILEQNGKTFIGERNPDKTSLVDFIYRNPEGKQICSAFRKDGLTICETEILFENGRCRLHGGRSLAGAASPKFKTGKNSKYLPARLLERYEEALADETLTDMTDDLAAVEARIADLYQQLDAGGGGEIFKNAKEAFNSFRAANQDGDAQMMRESLRRLGEELDRGATESFIWREIRELQEQKRKIILSHAKHLQMTGQMISTKEANLIVSALLDAVRTEVTDPNKLNAIQQKFLSITQRGRTKQLKA